MRRKVAFVWLNKRMPMWITRINGCRPANGYGSGRASFRYRLSCDCSKSLCRKSRRFALISEYPLIRFFNFRKKYNLMHREIKILMRENLFTYTFNYYW